MSAQPNVSLFQARPQINPEPPENFSSKDVSLADLEELERTLVQQPGGRWTTTQRFFFEALLSHPTLDPYWAAKQVGVKDRTDPVQSVRGGAHYLVRMLKKIPARIPMPDRQWMALAGYNVGFGHLEDARRLTQSQGGDRDKWSDVRQRLPLLSQKKYYSKLRYGYARGREPVNYVGNIRNYYDLLVWRDQERPRDLPDSAREQQRTPP